MPCIASGLVYFSCLLAVQTPPERVVSIYLVAAYSVFIDFGEWMSLIVYMAIGMIVLLLMESDRKKYPGRLDSIILTPDDAENLDNN